MPNRFKIVEFLLRHSNQNMTTREVNEGVRIPLMTCWRELKELEYLGAVKYEKGTTQNKYGNPDHDPEKDGWQLLNPAIFEALFLVPRTSTGQDIEKTNKEEEDYSSVDVSGTGRDEHPEYVSVLRMDQAELGECDLCHGKEMVRFSAEDVGGDFWKLCGDCGQKELAKLNEANHNG